MIESTMISPNKNIGDFDEAIMKLCHFNLEQGDALQVLSSQKAGKKTHDSWLEQKTQKTAMVTTGLDKLPKFLKWIMLEIPLNKH